MSHSCAQIAYRGPVGRRLAPTAKPYRRADGTTSWRVRIRANGRQTTETFDSEAAANVFIAQAVDPRIGVERAVALRARTDTSSPDYVPTVEEMLHLHVEQLTGVDERTRDDYLAIARRTWLPAIGAFRVDDVERADVARWVNASTGQLAPKSIRNALSVLAATLGSAMHTGHIAANPATRVRIPRAGEEQLDDMRILTHAQFDRLFAEIPEREQPIVVWMFGTGTRFSETTAQQVGDIDLAAGQTLDEEWHPAPTTRVVRAWKRGGRIGPPKSRAGRRTIVLPSEVVDVIEPLMADQPADAWLFRTSSGRPLLHSNFFNRVWRPATMRASICPDHRLKGCTCFSTKPQGCPHHRTVPGKRDWPPPCGCPGTLPFLPRIHDARHTHASWLIATGIRLDVIQDRLGHEDFLTTQRLYGHLMPDARLQAGAAASAAFSQTRLGQPARRPQIAPGHRVVDC